MSTTKLLRLFIKNTWDGDVSYSEAVKPFTSRQIQVMESLLEENRELVEGLPEAFEPDEEAEELLQQLVNNID